MPVVEQVIKEGRLTFRFPDQALSSQYDEWAHYRRQFNSAFGGTKAVDILYAEGATGWLVEVKDYREHCRTKTIDLAEEVAIKVRDTLAGLISARLHAQDPNEKNVAKGMLKSRRLRVVLHLEQPDKQTRLRPKAIDPAAILQRLKNLLKAIDPHPCVVNQNSMKAEMAWTVEG